MDCRGVEPLYQACKARVISRYTNSQKTHQLYPVAKNAWWQRILGITPKFTVFLLFKPFLREQRWNMSDLN